MDTEAIFSAAPRMRFKTQGFFFAGASMLAASIWIPLQAPRASPLGILASLTIGLLLCTVFVAVGRGYAHTCVVVTDAEVVIHNVGTTDAFPFDEVLGFDTITRTVSNIPGVPTAVLRLTPRAHGVPRSFPVTALSWGPDARASTARRPGERPFGFEVHWAELHALVDEINAELDARRGGTPTAERLGHAPAAASAPEPMPVAAERAA